MTAAYNELYIENAQRVFAQMLHCAVCDLYMDYDRYMRLFIHSGIADQFERGNPRYVAGMSGSELVNEVMHSVTGEYLLRDPAAYDTRSEAYWTGYTLSYYQWASRSPFHIIQRDVPASVIAGMYRKYHEMDIRQSVDEIERLRKKAMDTRRVELQERRQSAAMSQRMLAEDSGVPLRTIQQYEQGQKDLRRASYETVEKLARTLKCRPEDLTA